MIAEPAVLRLARLSCRLGLPGGLAPTIVLGVVVLLVVLT